jgi:hypothetical protein
MGKIWELDFYSRPIVDDRGKKRWEMLICEAPLSVEDDPDQLFRYSQFCANTDVNSIWLREALETAIAEADTAPTQIRFFRRQMNNMISRTCKDMGLAAKPSRRTVALHHWMQQRYEQVYPQQEGYQPSTNPSVGYAATAPQPLPDALESKQWAIVSLEASAFAEMPEWDIDFSEAFPLDLVGLTPETRIPGLIIFSPRATPVAAWMSGLEMAFLRLEPNPRSQLVLETGSSDAWTLANLTPDLLPEAEGFMQAKDQAKGVHFIAVQSDPDSEAFAGFWLLQELHLA